MKLTTTCILLSVVILSGCTSTSRDIPTDPEDTMIITGRVHDVHILGKKKETVTVCHFDPRFVVTVETSTGIRNLAIHSPTRTFMGVEPVGKDYRFELSKSGDTFRLRKAEKVVP